MFERDGNAYMVFNFLNKTQTDVFVCFRVVTLQGNWGNSMWGIIRGYRGIVLLFVMFEV